MTVKIKCFGVVRAHYTGCCPLLSPDKGQVKKIQKLFKAKAGQ